VLGADVEFGNFIHGSSARQETGPVASRLLLSRIDGVATDWAKQPTSPSVRGDSNDLPDAHYQQTGFHVQDWGRKFLPSTGGCAYIDLDHLELPIPEVTGAVEFVGVWHATIRAARRAAAAVNETLPEGLRIQVLANNSDGLGHSYGSHLNVLVSRKSFNDIFHYRIQHLLFLASYQASSILFTGQGKVGTENAKPYVPFQLSQRADFFETLVGLQTTYRRPLVNSRDESLCGSRLDAGLDPELARLHVIFYDSNLCHVANFLKVGVLQLIVVMIAENRISAGLILDDPLAAVLGWSHDPSLKFRARTLSGHAYTAVEHQFRLLELAEAHHQRHGFDTLVPHAAEILRLWRDVIQRLAAGQFDSLFGLLDWVTKLYCLRRAMRRRRQLTWESPELKHLDHLYSNIDPQEGLYWAYEQQGLVQQLVTDAQIEHYTREPPENTRAWTRAMLLRLGGHQVDAVDWDQIRFKLRDAYGWAEYRTVWLPHPLEMTKAQTGHLFADDITLADVLEELTRNERPNVLH
jgi:proteasome accessory factor A